MSQVELELRALSLVSIEHFDVNIKIGRSETPLLVQACKNGNYMVAKTLVRRNVDIDAADKNGYTALMKAAKEGYLEVTKLLVCHKADVQKVLSTKKR